MAEPERSWQNFTGGKKVQILSLKSKLCSRMLITVISKRETENAFMCLSWLQNFTVVPVMWKESVLCVCVCVF
jgi:hypothetical protein